MKKISEADLKAMRKEGLKVRRKMGEQPSKPDQAPVDLPEKEVVQPTIQVEEPRPHASMGASMEATAASEEALRKLVAMNTAVIEQFQDRLSELERPRDYTFDVQRDEDKLLKRIHMRAGIYED